jgi:uncharacterized protein (TIGR02271 family)
MSTSLISIFDDSTIARQAMGELIKAGVDNRHLEILSGGADEIASGIVERGFDEEEAKTFAEAVSRGKTLLAARTNDENAATASEIMERFESVPAKKTANDGRGETVQGIEEELSVGKRKVASEGVRIKTKVTETPVEETVTLRDETVEASRKPVSRKATPDELDAAFAEKTVEMIGTSEEVEVNKEARVVEEVTVGKRTEERAESVQDAVRRSTVEVEKIGPKSH